MRAPSIVSAVLLTGAWLSAGSTTFAQDEPINLCGRAHVSASSLIDEPPACLDASTRSAREAYDQTDVLHYALTIEISNLNTGANNCTVTGTNIMTIRSLSDGLTEFTFRLHSNYTLTTLTVTDGMAIIPVTANQTSNTTRVVTLNRAYAMNEEFTLTVGYTGTSVSLDDSIDVTTQGGTPIVYTLSEPFGEYTWWPCKDGDRGQPGDNSDKATMEFTITTPNNYVVPSNGSLQGVDTLSGNRKRYRWATGYQITPYLVSFAATNYNTWTRTYTFPAGPHNPAGTMPVEFYIYPGFDTPTNRTNWEKCLNMLTTFRGVYGEYPFVNEKYGIYNFNYGGGMEHQTITGQGSFSESLTAHELAHQWWGDMITCKDWRHIWLNEGFATYSECIWEERKGGGVNSAAYTAAINGRRPGSNGTLGSTFRYNASSLNSIFNSTYSYNKGAWVLHMLRHVVGDATFFNILAAYRSQYAYGAADTEDFRAVAEAVSGKDLAAFFDQWVYQKGAPTYDWGWQTTNVAGQNYLLARIAQTQSATAGSPPQTLNEYVMPIDLVATVSGSPQTIVVQNDARAEWFVVPTNAPVTAVSFDPAPWILRGTTNNVAYAPGPPKVVATNPAPGAVLPHGVSQVAITYHTPVFTSLGDYTLVGDTIGPQSISILSVLGDNPIVVASAGPLPADTYTLTVADNVSAMNSGLALDGETADANNPASLPSGDGLPGGDAVVRFTILPCEISADIDANCLQDSNDITSFVQTLLGMDTDPDHMARSDMNESGEADGDDIAAFVAATTGT